MPGVFQQKIATQQTVINLKMIRVVKLTRKVENFLTSTSDRTSRSLHTSSISQPFGPASGTPGRCGNSDITATVFGGYGFVGRYFLSELGRSI